MAIFEAASLLACRIRKFTKVAPFTPSSRPYVQISAERSAMLLLWNEPWDAPPVSCVMSVRPIHDKLAELLAPCDINRA